MFKYVDHQDGVEPGFQSRKVFGIKRVNVTDIQVGLAVGVRSQVTQVVRINVGGNIVVAGNELIGEVADTRADFQDSVADVGTQGVPHPEVKLASGLKPTQNG